jgi:hypothetical protein
MALLGGRRFRRRKKEVLFVEGVYIDHADVLTPGVDRNDETFHIFGIDSPETDVQHNYGTLTIGVLDKYTSNAILDLVTQQDPADTAPRQYRVPDLQTVDVWANVKDEGNTKYVKSYYFKGWAPGMPVPSGDPNAKAAYQVSGNAELPRQFHGAWVTSKKVSSGSPSLGVSPLLVPLETVYALSIRAIDQTSGFEQEEIDVTSTMVLSNGTVSFTEIAAAASVVTSPTHAFVVFLQSGTGVYPNVKPDSLRA